MVLKGFPNGVTWGQQYNIGEKPTVILYTYINHHVGTPKQKHISYCIIQYFWAKSSRLRYSNNYIEKLSQK